MGQNIRNMVIAATVTVIVVNGTMLRNYVGQAA